MVRVHAPKTLFITAANITEALNQQYHHKLDEMVEEGVLKVRKEREGGFLFGKNYLVYEIK